MGRTYRREKKDRFRKSGYKRNKKARFKENSFDKVEPSLDNRIQYNIPEGVEKHFEKFDNRGKR